MLYEDLCLEIQESPLGEINFENISCADDDLCALNSQSPLMFQDPFFFFDEEKEDIQEPFDVNLLLTPKRKEEDTQIPYQPSNEVVDQLKEEVFRFLNPPFSDPQRANLVPIMLGFSVTDAYEIPYKIDDHMKGVICIAKLTRTISKQYLRIFYDTLIKFGKLKKQTVSVTVINRIQEWIEESEEVEMIVARQQDFLHHFVNPTNVGRVTKEIINPSERLMIRTSACNRPSLYLTKQAVYQLVFHKLDKFRPYVNHPYSSKFSRMIFQKVLPKM